MDQLLSWLPDGNQIPYTNTVRIKKNPISDKTAEQYLADFTEEDVYMRSQGNQPFFSLKTLVIIAAIILVVLIFKKS